MFFLGSSTIQMSCPRPMCVIMSRMMSDGIRTHQLSRIVQSSQPYPVPFSDGRRDARRAITQIVAKVNMDQVTPRVKLALLRTGASQVMSEYFFDSNVWTTVQLAVRQAVACAVKFWLVQRHFASVGLHPENGIASARHCC